MLLKSLYSGIELLGRACPSDGLYYVVHRKLRQAALHGSLIHYRHSCGEVVHMDKNLLNVVEAFHHEFFVLAVNLILFAQAVVVSYGRGAVDLFRT